MPRASCNSANAQPSAANTIISPKATSGGISPKIRAAPNTVRYSTATPVPCSASPKAGRFSRLLKPTASSAAPAVATIASRASIGNSPA